MANLKNIWNKYKESSAHRYIALDFILVAAVGGSIATGIAVPAVIGGSAAYLLTDHVDRRRYKKCRAEEFVQSAILRSPAENKSPGIVPPTP